MKLPALKKHLASLSGAQEKLLPPPSNVLTFNLGSKTFAYFKTSEPEKWRFSLRVTPERFLELTDTPGVKPARYMARFHWITIVKVEQFPESYLLELIDYSYQKALSGLSRKAQKELLSAPGV